MPMPEQVSMQEQIGTAAGVIWTHLNQSGECSLAQLKKATGLSAPLCDWAIGWLARENVVTLTQNKRSYLIALK
jgi:hypothetical protein